MKYLYIDISASYHTTGIGDEYKGELWQEDLGVADALWNELQNWNHRYQSQGLYRELSCREPNSPQPDHIKQLDDEGLQLLRKFADVLDPNTKLRYRSWDLGKTYSQDLGKWLD